MRSDVKYLAKCGKKSLYYCQMSGKTICPKLHPDCIYIPKTRHFFGSERKRKERNLVHPVAANLTVLFIRALANDLPNTAWCIDLARTAISWELIAKAENKPELFVQNKIRQKIERDKGVKIR